MRLPVVLQSGEDGWIVATCPVIPGCITQGRTRDEALANVREAILLCLENREVEGWPLPSDAAIHDEVDRGTLRRILRTTGISAEELVELLP